MYQYLKWKLESFVGMLKFLGNHPSVETDISEIADDVTELQSTVVAIKAAGQVQVTPLEGIAQETKEKKRLMARTVIGVARKARAMARRAGKWDLLEQLDFSITYINSAPKVDAVARAKAIQKAVTDNATFLTVVKPADFSAMTDTIKAYDLAQLNPRTAQEQKKAQGTDVLDGLYKKGSTAADNIYDFVTGFYELTNPELIDELNLNCGIKPEGVHHNTIKATFIYANPPADAITHLLEGGVMKIVELNKTAVSDINGLAEIQKFKTGTYHVEFSKEGFVTKQMIVHVRRG
jgi:hypothetical protein